MASVGTFLDDTFVKGRDRNVKAWHRWSISATVRETLGFLTI